MQNDIRGAKPHYELLDGLRGVAALLVIWYHVFEAFATSPVDQSFNHGYLAVDFFFVLSGFVIGYAYDDRFRSEAMTTRGFVLRRVIRLQPMVVMAALLGVVSFIIQGCEKWDGTSVSTTAVVLSLVFGLLCIPSLPGTLPEVRGNGEMFPLNGPSWSLFFEYIGSFMYALFLRRFSTAMLRLWVAVSGVGLAAWAIANMSGAYHLGVGWSMMDYGFAGGFLRVSFSMGIGLLMSREFKPRRIRGAFWICSGILLVVLSMPYVTTDGEPSVLNGIYDAVCALFVFPLVVWTGACGTTTDRVSTSLCNFYGKISYPVYIIHYPAMYPFYSYVWTNGLTFSQTWPIAVGIFFGVQILAWFFLRYYDEPVRRRLSRRFTTRP